jgi:preprotein translocase subunit YajC
MIIPGISIIFFMIFLAIGGLIYYFVIRKEEKKTLGERIRDKVVYGTEVYCERR